MAPKKSQAAPAAPTRRSSRVQKGASAKPTRAHELATMTLIKIKTPGDIRTEGKWTPPQSSGAGWGKTVTIHTKMREGQEKIITTHEVSRHLIPPADVLYAFEHGLTHELLNNPPKKKTPSFQPPLQGSTTETELPENTSIKVSWRPPVSGDGPWTKIITRKWGSNHSEEYRTDAKTFPPRDVLRAYLLKQPHELLRAPGPQNTLPDNVSAQTYQNWHPENWHQPQRFGAQETLYRRLNANLFFQPQTFAQNRTFPTIPIPGVPLNGGALQRTADLAASFGVTEETLAAIATHFGVPLPAAASPLPFHQANFGYGSSGSTQGNAARVDPSIDPTLETPNGW